MKYLITGAAGGIGFATAAELARVDTDCHILLTDRSASGLVSAAERLRGRCRIETCVADLEDAAAPARIAETAQNKLGSLDGVVSNAGVTHGFKLNELGVDEFERVFRINLRAAWLLAKSCHPALKAARGSFVAVSSIAGSHPTPGLGAYCVTKAALIMLVRQLSLEWAADGIRCNCVAPGSTMTPMTEKGFSDPERKASRESSIPAGRLGQPEEIAHAIAFLLDRRSSFVNGVNLPVDGALDVALMHGKKGSVSPGDRQ